MSTLGLGICGGLISFVSTAIGSVAALVTHYRIAKNGTSRFSLSIDFALGIMVSASAFSLIGPAALDAHSKGHSIISIATWSGFGIFAVLLMKWVITHLESSSENQVLRHRLSKRVPVASSRFLLAAVLMLHNFPEGLASGAAVAGLGWKASVGILSAISIQNLPEGALMVYCLKAMGWKTSNAFWDGIASGGVELLGGVVAGFLLHLTHDLLPSLLALAGGAMMASVWVELREKKEHFWSRIFSRSFQIGFLSLAMLQILQSIDVF